MEQTPTPYFPCCVVDQGANLVPRASFPALTSEKTRALGATISGLRIDADCAVNQMTRIRLFPLLFQNGCYQSSRFPTAGQGERSSGNEIALEHATGTKPIMQTAVTNICLNCITFINLTFRMLQHTSSEVIIIQLQINLS